MTISLSIDEALAEKASAALQSLISENFASRLFEKDATLWGSDATAEASVRLGWVDPFAESERVLNQAVHLRDQQRSRQINRVVLCGMGGSSLGPEVVARESGVQLVVVDSTHPSVVARAIEGDLSKTAVVVSSKSGGTLETTTHAAFFEDAFKRAGLEPADHIVYVTDPGSALSQKQEDGYNVFLADPTVGGRFSVLTAFGIVPSVLAGVDFQQILDDARQAKALVSADSPDNPALLLASALYAALPERYILLLNEPPTQPWGLCDWIEQLVAESTGKEGKGILPISLPSDAPEFDQLPLNSLTMTLGSSEALAPSNLSLEAPLGGQFFLWEVATAALGCLMEINPFDQPDVESAKIAAHQALQAQETSEPAQSLLGFDEVLATLQSNTSDKDYVAIQAFVDPSSEMADSVRVLRTKLAAELKLPVALGWGPRYLHSTGQLHKGGPATGAFVQIIDVSGEQLQVPGKDGTSLADILTSQARGDQMVLTDREKLVISYLP